MKPQQQDNISDGLERAAGYGEKTGGRFEIRPLAEIEQAYIEMAIARCGGDISAAARLLRISPSTIYRKRSSWQRQAPLR